MHKTSGDPLPSTQAKKQYTYLSWICKWNSCIANTDLLLLVLLAQNPDVRVEEAEAKQDPSDDDRGDHDCPRNAPVRPRDMELVD